MQAKFLFRTASCAKATIIIKAKILLFTCIALFLGSCRDKNTLELQVPYVEYGWDNFPFERINCYFPEEGTVQMYVSDKDNSFNLTAGKLDAEYHARPGSDPVEDADGGFPLSTEMYSALVCFTNNATNDLIAPQSLRFSIDDNRKTIVGCDVCVYRYFVVLLQPLLTKRSIY